MSHVVGTLWQVEGKEAMPFPQQELKDTAVVHMRTLVHTDCIVAADTFAELVVEDEAVEEAMHEMEIDEAGVGYLGYASPDSAQMFAWGMVK